MSQVNALSSSARSASYLILLQLFTRLLTFTFNQLILRHTTPAVFGFATIQLELLASTVLFLSREGFRIAIQREKDVLQRCINLAFIPYGLGVAGSLLGCWILWKGADAETQQLGGFGTSIVLYGIATVIELLGEPAFIVTQKMLWFKLRAISEGLAVASRCAITYIVTAFLASHGTLEEYGAIPFALGQLAYAIVLTGGLSFSVAVFREWNFWPKRIKSEGATGRDYMFYRPTLVLAFSVTGQSLFKHVLTEGDKFILTMLTTPHIQGTYAIVSNYGSLIARILFQPVEESLRTILSQVLADPKPSSVKSAFNLFRIIFRLYFLLGLIALSLGPPLLPTLAIPILETLIGKAFPATALLPILYAYLYYIPLMAVNGIFESFVASVAVPPDLARQSRAMLLFSLVFLSSAWLFFTKLEMGGEGLVWANCINMTARILWSAQFGRRWIDAWNANLARDDKMRPIRALPRIQFMLVSALVGLGMRWEPSTKFKEALLRGIAAGITLIISVFSPFFCSSVHRANE